MFVSAHSLPIMGIGMGLAMAAGLSPPHHARICEEPAPRTPPCRIDQLLRPPRPTRNRAPCISGAITPRFRSIRPPARGDPDTVLGRRQASLGGPLGDAPRGRRAERWLGGNLRSVGFEMGRCQRGAQGAGGDALCCSYVSSKTSK